ncbi:MAG: DUF2796 domain-containing protein [Pseudomonadota bacterium]
MSSQTSKFVIFAIGSALMLAGPASAGSKHSHGHSHSHDHGKETKHTDEAAHVHGSGKMNIAIDGNKMTVELTAPSDDILGFEHKAKTKAEKKTKASASKTLNAFAKIVSVPSGAGCTVSDADIEFTADGDDHHGHSHGHSHSHDHGKKKAKKAEAEAEHSDVVATYQVSCKNPEQLTTINLPYFEAFPRARELDINVITGKGQYAFEIEKASAKLDLGGKL